MPIVDMVSCPFCNTYWVNPMTDEVCANCKEPYLVLQTVVALQQAVQAVDQLNFNKIDAEQRSALRAALGHLDAIVEALNKYPPKG